MSRYSNESFTNIAEDLHFDSIHYFTRLFKKLSGMTPSQYRTQCKKQERPETGTKTTTE